MKKISIIVFLLMGFISYSYAQDARAQAGDERRTLEERVEIRTSKMVGELALTPEQAAKLKEIHRTQAEKMKQIREKQAAQNQNLRQEARSIADQTEKEYQAILTPEQFEKYKQNKAQQKEGYTSGRKTKRKPGRNL